MDILGKCGEISDTGLADLAYSLLNISDFQI